MRALSRSPEQGRFPRGFLWGAGTSSYQIEGAAFEDGRGESIWDRFVRVPGAIKNGDTGDVAVDHYHRVEQDVELMSELGLRAYRFSTAWPRVLPNGSGRVNKKGLDFYQRLVDLLLEHNIEPFLTLFHWDLPQVLHEKGGWADRSTVEIFAEYADVMVETLGDRVRHWSTVCEPWTVSFLGYSWGIHAPGVKEPPTAYVVAHHLLLAHAAAARLIRDGHRQVMLNLNLYPIYPASDRAEDMQLAAAMDGVQNRLFLDPLLKGAYPADVQEIVDKVAGLGHVHDGDLKQISGSLDALGVNYYSAYQVEAADVSQEIPAFPGVGGVRFVQTRKKTAMGWEIHPDGLYEILVRLKDDYPPVPMYVTENGAAFEDVRQDGSVHDQDRIDYVGDHIEACGRAIAAEVDLRGYFLWSLMDNFEWAEGYSKRFGITWVDDDQERVLKDSARWYRDLIAREQQVSAS